MRRAAAATLAVLALLAPALTGGCGGDDEDTPPADPAAAAADRFLDRYLDGDGRVVRRDQGGDTVSEGQAYALLLTALTGDEARFDRAWAWTREHLQRPDGLLAWRWQDGRVADPQPAADADLDTARALAVAGSRFARPELRGEAARIARAILAQETVHGRLVAGPWARATRTVNPSYASPAAEATLAGLGDRAAWDRLRRTGIDTARLLGDDRALPPDWARIGEDGAVAASGPPADPGATPVYGYDAVRLAVRMAEACDGDARAAAAQLWPVLRDGDPAILPRERDGRGAAGAVRSAVALVGAAAAAHAAGDAAARDRLLGEAEALDAASPTYYGAAWIALGRVLLARPCS
ncbi:MAG TPA: glycosyl hydrolase family 8 [Capillimicrobium sp.]|nr:glycosyl hydrolase family 8 [Capillimicrobium sp.]